jgi:hypothetical protein
MQRQPMAWVLLITQILLIGGYAWLLIESIDTMLTPNPAELGTTPSLSITAPPLTTEAP